MLDYIDILDYTVVLLLGLSIGVVSSIIISLVVSSRKRKKISIMMSESGRAKIMEERKHIDNMFKSFQALLKEIKIEEDIESVISESLRLNKLFGMVTALDKSRWAIYKTLQKDNVYECRLYVHTGDIMYIARFILSIVDGVATIRDREICYNSKSGIKSIYVVDMSQPENLPERNESKNNDIMLNDGYGAVKTSTGEEE